MFSVFAVYADAGTGRDSFEELVALFSSSELAEQCIRELSGNSIYRRPRIKEETVLTECPSAVKIFHARSCYRLSSDGQVIKDILAWEETCWPPIDLEGKPGAREVSTHYTGTSEMGYIASPVFHARGKDVQSVHEAVTTALNSIETPPITPTLSRARTSTRTGEAR